METIEQMLEQLSQSNAFDSLSPPLQMTIFLGSLVLLPAVLASMTCFTRIVIVLSFVRRGMSTQEIPPNTVLLGLAMFLTLFIMGPTWARLSQQAVLPYLEGSITASEGIRTGTLIQKQFMLRHTRKQDISLFLHLSDSALPQEPMDTPFHVLAPAFIISELKTAFLMGFCVFIPFLLVDLVIATILMSMGMWMMPPVIISLPFKVLLFVLADGWHMVSLSLNYSFG